ncbi:23403_t:CDS:1 [Gigaspora margarita]|uniref:23403_t:CDS:1 n=1 Tax=Gigaspora margarita TaxID=4874 RepID=A0ABN7UN33_GIGMA|nr:23403_t:CDS:1 [Gigaspora margarita]
MSTNLTPQNISYLKTLALNILKNGSPDIIAKGVEVPELDPCSRYKEELFLYKLKKPFIALICGHIYHRSCLEDYIKDLLQCPKCAIEIEPIDYSGTYKPSSQENQVQSTAVPMQISLQMVSNQSQNTVTPVAIHIFDSTLFPDNTKQVQKRSSKDTTKDKSSNKKPKQTKKESHVLNELIKELSTKPEIPQTPVTRKENANNFLDLYNNITYAENQNEITNQEVITCYYHFGKALDNRYDHYKKSNPKRTAQALVNKEVRSQLPNSVSDDLLRKKKEWALKVYNLFSEIGIEKIKRVKSFTVSSILKLSQDKIDQILIKFAK